MEEVGMKRRNTVLVMAGVLLGTFIGALDTTVAGIAMPKIAGELNGLSLYMWPFTMYMLSSTVITPIAGKLSDIYGRKTLFYVGMALFLAASVCCGAAGNMMQLIIFRGVQGLGGGVLVTICSTIIGDIFAPAERGKYQGFSMGTNALACVIGPFLGGILTDHASWRWIFYINVPVGIVALVLLYAGLPNYKIKTGKTSMDYFGIAAFVLAVVPMLLAFSWANNKYDWNSAVIIGLLVFSAVMIAVFILIEKKAKEPIIPIDLFKNSVFTIGILILLLSTAAMYAATIYLPVFVEDVIGVSATNSGAVLVPMMVMMLIASIFFGQIVSHTAKYKTIAISGMGVVVLGMILLAGLGVNSRNLDVVIGMAVLGAGVGTGMPIVTVVLQSVVSREKLSVATSSAAFFRNVGGTMGTAILGSVMITSMTQKIKSIDASGFPAQIKALLANPQSLTSIKTINNLKQVLPDKMFSYLYTQIKSAISLSVNHIFVILVFATGIAFLLSFFWKKIPLRKKKDA